MGKFIISILISYDESNVACGRLKKNEKFWKVVYEELKSVGTMTGKFDWPLNAICG